MSADAPLTPEEIEQLKTGRRELVAAYLELHEDMTGIESRVPALLDNLDYAEQRKRADEMILARLDQANALFAALEEQGYDMGDWR